LPVKVELIAKYKSRIVTSSVKATIPINGWTIVIDAPYNCEHIIYKHPSESALDYLYANWVRKEELERRIIY
jgi:hypothetical protein